KSVRTRVINDEILPRPSMMTPRGGGDTLLPTSDALYGDRFMDVGNLMSFTRCGLTALGAAAILSACSGQPVDDSKLTMIDGRRTFELLHEERQRVVSVDAQSRS